MIALAPALSASLLSLAARPTPLPQTAVRAEGVAIAIVGAAYDDVFREFTPRVRFSAGRTDAGAAVPLQPSLALGLNLHRAGRERPLVGGLIGVGPSGITLASLRLVYGLGEFRPRFR